MHLIAHLATALPFVALGQPLAAIGCVLPDVAWVPHELALRRAGGFKQYAAALQERDLIAYRAMHSLAFIGLAFCVSPMLAIGLAIHVACDLPTHSGIMAQMPLYPCRKRWPRAWRLKEHRNDI